MKPTDDRKIPIRRGGKVVGYLNAPLHFRLWQTIKRWATRVWKLFRLQGLC